MTPTRRSLLKLSSAALMTGALSARAQNEAKTEPVAFHTTDAATNYKCLFNHELLVIAGK